MTPLDLAQRIIRAGTTNTVESAAHEPSFWLRARLVDIDTRCVTGQMFTCGHAGPLLVALWAADATWCLPCSVSTLDVQGQDAYRCDRCTIVSDTIVLATIVGDHAVVIFGLCKGCADREVHP